MKRHKIWQRLLSMLSALHLADQCLLVFMAILMLQSTYQLLFCALATQGGDTLDVVVRTTAAAIFGYFVSANFQNSGTDEQAGPWTCKNPAECRDHLQILVVAVIGIFSLLVLVVVRNHPAAIKAAGATISQLRDFVSGSVGFLIGHTTHQKRSP